MTTVLKSFTRWFNEKSVQIDALVFDIDGVLLTDSAASGARSLLSRLTQQRMPYCLLTNDGNHSPVEKAGYLNKTGIDVASEDIISCSHGLISVTRDRDLHGKLFFVMGDLGTPCYAEIAGLKTTRDVQALSLCSGVIVSEENYDWESTFNAVINFFIDHPEALLICSNPDAYFPGNGEMKIRLGAGSVARFVVKTLRTYGPLITPIYLGKPYPAIFEYTHRFLEKKAGRGIPAKNVLMVGDNLDSDIVGAIDAGYTSALMLTGVTTRHMLDRSDVSPDFVFERL